MFVPFKPQHITTNKSPWATIDGEDVADSQLVIERLAKIMEKDLEKDLDPKQKGIELATRIMLEDHLYWVLIMDRYFWVFERMTELSKYYLYDIAYNSCL